jgi:ribose transport system permease protein
VSAQDDVLRRASAAPSRASSVTGEVLQRVGILPILIVVLFVFFGLVEPRFLHAQNLYTVLTQSVYLIMITLAQTVVLLTGGFDLSVGSSVALTSIVVGQILVAYADHIAVGITLASLAGVGVGTLIGVINGAVISLFTVSPFIVTLAMLSMAAGGALILSGGVPVFGLPDAFARILSTGLFLGLPVPWLVTIVILVILYLTLNWMRIGRYIYALGGNSEAARLSGVPVRFYLWLTYAMAGAVVGLGGVMLTARVGSGEPNLGATLPLESIAAAVVGGVSLRGGEGTLTGATLGAIFFVFLRNGMDLIRISSYVQMIVTGLLLVLAIVVDRYIHR